MELTSLHRFGIIYIIFILIISGKAQTPGITVDPASPAIGNTVTLTCNDQFNFENKTYRWFVNSTEVQGNPYTINANVLSFIAGYADRFNKYYNCKVYSGDLERASSDGVNIGLRYPPVIALPTTYTCEKSKYIVLRCQAEGNPKPQSFKQWTHYFGEKQIRTLYGNTVGNASELTFPSCNYQDAGTYVCSVGNGVLHPNNSDVSSASTVLVIRDIPVINGHVIVNTTNKYDIMITYSPDPASTDQKLYHNNIQIVVTKYTINRQLPHLMYGEVVDVAGTILIIKDIQPGKYRYEILNEVGKASREVEIGLVTEAVTTPTPLGNTPESDCSFSSLEFNVQVVIIVMVGVVTCVLVLSVSLVLTHRCKKDTHKTGRKSKESFSETTKEKQPRKRIKSVLDDGSVVYDEIVDAKSLKGKKKPKGRVTVQEGYEEVEVKPKTTGQSYEVLKKNSSKGSRVSKVFQFKKSAKQNRLKSLVANRNVTTDNVYTVGADRESPALPPPRNQSNPSLDNDNTDIAPPTPARQRKVVENVPMKDQTYGNSKTVEQTSGNSKTVEQISDDLETYDDARSVVRNIKNEQITEDLMTYDNGNSVVNNTKDKQNTLEYVQMKVPKTKTKHPDTQKESEDQYSNLRIQ